MCDRFIYYNHVDSIDSNFPLLFVALQSRCIDGIFDIRVFRMDFSIVIYNRKMETLSIVLLIMHNGEFVNGKIH